MSERLQPLSTHIASFGACLALLWTALAGAQTAEPAHLPPPPASSPAAIAPEPAPPSVDELAAPDEVPASDVLVAPPSVVVQTPAPRRALPIRAQRRLALTGELGFNGLAGFGAILTYHADPHLSFDLGAGLALVGLKVGLRGRVNLLKGPVTPFFGAGFMAASGWDSNPDLTDPNTQDQLNLKLLPCAFSQAVAGIDWTTQGGFTLVGALGYAWLLSGDNVKIITGEPTDEEREGLRVVFGSSPVVSIAIGHSF